MKSNRIFLSVIFFILVISGCSNQPLEKEKQNVNGSGITYQFQLPKAWKEEKKLTSNSDRNAVFRAYDTRSKSTMYVLIFPKESVEEKGFGEKTRKELASQNNYSDPEKLYMKEYKIDGQQAYKYTFETSQNQRRYWAHYYCIFTKHGVIQLLYYSANDSAYKERAKLIDQSVETVKEKSFDSSYTAPKEEQNAGDKIEVSNNDIKVTMTGAMKLAGEKGANLYAIRYQITNVGTKAFLPDEFQNLCIVKQGEQVLSKGEVPDQTPLYQVKEAVANAKKELQPGTTTEAVLVYQLVDESELTLSFSKEAFGDQPTYPLLIPKQ